MIFHVFTLLESVRRDRAERVNEFEVHFDKISSVQREGKSAPPHYPIVMCTVMKFWLLSETMFQVSYYLVNRRDG